MAEPQVSWVAGVGLAALSAVGGWKGIGTIVRKTVATRSHVRAVRADNELFKAEVRDGLKTLTHHVQRIDAELRAQVQADARPIMQACDEGQVMFVNAAFTREFGWTLDQMRGRGWLTNAIGGMDQKRIREQWTAAVDNGDYLQTAASVMHRDGRLMGMVGIECHPKKCTEDTKADDVRGTKFGWQIVLLVKTDAGTHK